MTRGNTTRRISAEDFLTTYAHNCGLTREGILARRVVATCHCDWWECDGWQVVAEDLLMPWRGEEVVIRG